MKLLKDRQIDDYSNNISDTCASYPAKGSVLRVNTHKTTMSQIKNGFLHNIVIYSFGFFFA